MITKDENGIQFGPAHAFDLSPVEVMRFYQANWQRRIALELPQFYAWQFLAPPASSGRDWNCVSVRGSEVLGVMGLNPRPFLLDGKKRHAAEMTTWVVSEAARGLGVGRGIMKNIQQNYEVAFGFGISEAAMPIYMTQGFRRLRRIPRYFRVFDVEAVRPHARIDRLGERLVGQWNSQPHAEVRSRPVAASALAGPAEVMGIEHSLYVRDAAHLAWRYEQHPVYKYELFEVETQNGAQKIGVVVRMDSIDDFRFIHVLDILGHDGDVPFALDFINELAATRRAAFVDFYCTSSSIPRYLMSSGWFSSIDDTCFQLANLFYPPEFRDDQTTSMVYWSRGDFNNLANVGRLYLTKQDLDLDRPTMSFYETQEFRQE